MDLSQDGHSILQKFFHLNPTVEFLRLQVVIYSGVVLVRVASKEYALSLAQKKAPIVFPTSVLTAPTPNAAINYDFIVVREDHWWPAWESLRVCHYYPSHAQVMCWLGTIPASPPESFTYCPRTQLHKMVERARKQHGIEFLVGFELEFYILEADGSPVRGIASHCFSTAGLRNRCVPIIEEIIAVLKKADIKVQQFHTESAGPGQWEISTGPKEPMAAVDALIYSQETIKTICTNHGLRATMFPKPFDKQGVTGMHCHLSISPIDQQEAFLAGMLASLPATAAFNMPNYDSYERVSRDAPVFWGSYNKTAPIRRINEGHWELRQPDATINPYLAVAANLAAGLNGIEENMPLTLQDPNKLLFSPIPAEERAKLGFTETVPTSLRESLQKLEADEGLSRVLGADLVKMYVKYKRYEETALSKMTLDERRKACMEIF